MTQLADRHALPDGAAPGLFEHEVGELAKEVPEWSVSHGRLRRDLQVRNFGAALALVNTLGRVAEEQNHHPDLLIHRWNRVRIELYTHTADGLSVNDFIMAAKFDRIIRRLEAAEPP